MKRFDIKLPIFTKETNDRSDMMVTIYQVPIGVLALIVVILVILVIFFKRKYGNAQKKVQPIPSSQPQRPGAQPCTQPSAQPCSQVSAQPQNPSDQNNVYGQDQNNVYGHTNQVPQVNVENSPADDQINTYENEPNAEKDHIYD